MTDHHDMPSLPALDTIHTIVFDFDGVFTDNKVYVDQDGREMICCDRGDGLAFDLVRAYQRAGRMSAELFVLSKETNAVVASRCKKLRLDCKPAIGDKRAFLDQYFIERFPGDENPYSGLVYLGNDLNDLPVMRKAGCSVAPEDAHALVKDVATHVFPQKGGNGFVRAFVERLLGIDALSEEELDELVSHC